MKSKLKWTIPIILIVIVLCGSAYSLFFKGETEATLANETLEQSTKTEEISLEETFPIESDIPVDYIWEISYDDALSSNLGVSGFVEVVNEENKVLDLDVSLKNDNKTLSIKPPNNGYEKGAYYEIEIKAAMPYEDGTFVKEPFKMGFVITKDEVEEATYIDSIIEVKQEDLVSDDEGTAILTKSAITDEIVEEKILLIPSSDQYQPQKAIKVTSVKTDKNNYIIDYVIPDITELFEALTIYKEYNLLADNAIIIPEKGIQMATIRSNESRVASSQSKTVSRKGENQVNVPETWKSKTSVNYQNGIEFSMTNHKVSYKNQDVYVDGRIKVHNPTFQLDYDLGLLKINRLNAKAKFKSEAEVKERMEIDFSELTTSKRKKWLFSKEIPIAKVILPTAIPGLVVLGEVEFEMGLNGENKMKIENFVTFELSQEYGIKKHKGEYKPHFKFNPQLDTGLVGSGIIEGKANGELGMALSAYGVIGIGIEGDAGVSARAETVLGATTESKDNKDIAGCAIIDAGLLTGASIDVDIFGDIDVWNYLLKEEYQSLLKLNTCLQMKDISVFPETLSMKPGNKVSLDVQGSYFNQKTTLDENLPILTGDKIRNLTITSLDSSVITPKIVQKNKKSVTNEFSKKATYAIVLEAAKEPSSEDSDIEVSYYDPQTKETFKQTIPVHIEGMKLSKDEIRMIMDNFMEIENIVYDTKEKSSIYSGEWNPESMAEKVMENLPESIKELASNKLLTKDLPKHTAFWIETSGEVPLFPKIDLDARMEVIENTPNRIQVKTFQLSNIYNYSLNVYINAIKENGKWLIDGYDVKDVLLEPLNLTREEVIKYEENRNKTDIEFIGEEIVTSYSDMISSDRTGKAYILKEINSNNAFGRFVDTGEYVYDNELPKKYLPVPEALRHDEAIQLVRDYLGWDDNSSMVVEYDHDNELNHPVIHVYENVDNGDGGHTATYGWYGVDPETGAVYDELFR